MEKTNPSPTLPEKAECEAWSCEPASSINCDESSQTPARYSQRRLRGDKNQMKKIRNLRKEIGDIKKNQKETLKLKHTIKIFNSIDVYQLLVRM